MSGVPILDRLTTYGADPRPDDPVLLPGAYVHTVEAVAYWPVGADLRLTATGDVAVGDLGRLALLRDGLEVWPPAAGWPDRHPSTLLHVQCTAGLSATDPETPAFRAAVVALTRELHTGRGATPKRPAWREWLPRLDVGGPPPEGAAVLLVTA